MTLLEPTQLSFTQATVNPHINPTGTFIVNSYCTTCYHSIFNEDYRYNHFQPGLCQDCKVLESPTVLTFDKYNKVYNTGCDTYDEFIDVDSFPPLVVSGSFPLVDTFDFTQFPVDPEVNPEGSFYVGDCLNCYASILDPAYRHRDFPIPGHCANCGNDCTSNEITTFKSYITNSTNVYCSEYKLYFEDESYRATLTPSRYDLDEIPRDGALLSCKSYQSCILGWCNIDQRTYPDHNIISIRPTGRRWNAINGDFIGLFMAVHKSYWPLKPLFDLLSMTEKYGGRHSLSIEFQESPTVEEFGPPKSFPVNDPSKAVVRWSKTHSDFMVLEGSCTKLLKKDFSTYRIRIVIPDWSSIPNNDKWADEREEYINDSKAYMDKLGYKEESPFVFGL